MISRSCAGSDPRCPHSFDTEITELTIGVLAARGLLPLGELTTEVHRRLGFGWHLDGQPVSADDVRIAIAQQSLVMKGLDLIDTENWRVWTTGAAALSLLPGATLLAATWTR